MAKRSNWLINHGIGDEGYLMVYDECTSSGKTH